MVVINDRLSAITLDTIYACSTWNEQSKKTMACENTSGARTLEGPPLLNYWSLAHHKSGPSGLVERGLT